MKEKKELRIVVREAVKDGVNGLETRIEGICDIDMLVEVVERVTDVIHKNFAE